MFKSFANLTGLSYTRGWYLRVLPINLLRPLQASLAWPDMDLNPPTCRWVAFLRVCNVCRPFDCNSLRSGSSPTGHGVLASSPTEEFQSWGLLKTNHDIEWTVVLIVLVQNVTRGLITSHYPSCNRNGLFNMFCAISVETDALL